LVSSEKTTPEQSAPQIEDPFYWPRVIRVPGAASVTKFCAAAHAALETIPPVRFKELGSLHATIERALVAIAARAGLSDPAPFKGVAYSLANSQRELRRLDWVCEVERRRPHCHADLSLLCQLRLRAVRVIEATSFRDQWWYDGRQIGGRAVAEFAGPLLAEDPLAALARRPFVSPDAPPYLAALRLLTRTEAPRDQQREAIRIWLNGLVRLSWQQIDGLGGMVPPPRRFPHPADGEEAEEDLRTLWRWCDIQVIRGRVAAARRADPPPALSLGLPPPDARPPSANANKQNAMPEAMEAALQLQEAGPARRDTDCTPQPVFRSPEERLAAYEQVAADLQQRLETTTHLPEPRYRYTDLELLRGSGAKNGPKQEAVAPSAETHQRPSLRPQETSGQLPLHATEPATPPRENSVRLEAAVWQVRYQEGETGNFPDRADSVFRHLLRMLPEPNRHFGALMFYPTPAGAAPLPQFGQDASSDDESLGQCRKKLAELIQEIKDAEDAHDAEAAGRLREEFDFLTKHLRAEDGPRRRGHRRLCGTPGPAKQADQALRMGFSRLRKRLQERGLRKLAEHLQEYLRNEGGEWWYAPSPGTLPWHVTRPDPPRETNGNR
jgi:hypothetical protein